MLRLKKYLLIFSILLCTNLIIVCNGAHVTGTFHPNEFFKFIIKFGFQKTELHSQRDSFGYIYGNITSKSSYPMPITFAVLDKYNFLEYYGNRTIYNKDLACQRMFGRLNRLAYDKTCNRNAKGDYLRQVPCPHGQLCDDEDAPTNVVPNNQFTYAIRDFIQPR